jgi:hypothetical protein
MSEPEPPMPDEPGPPTTPTTRRRHRPRRISAWVLVVLASILIPISIISVWAIRTVTDTDQYVETMAPLARNPLIVDRLASRATDELFSTHIVQDKLTGALPSKAKPFVTPITDEVHGYVEGLAVKVFSSQQFGKLWDTLNRHSHDAVINILTGKQTPLQKNVAKAGQIVLNLSPAINNLIASADAHGITVFNPLKSIADGNSLTFTVLSKQQVSKFSGLFNLVVKLKWVIPIVALVLGILAIILAVEHRKTLVRLAVGVALVTLLLLAGLSLGRITFLNHAAGGGFNRPAAGAVWDTLLRFLKTDLRWALLASILVAFGGWVAGPARYAVWIRSTCAKGGRWVGAQARELSSGAGRAAAESSGVRRSGAWIVEHLNGLRILGVIVAGLFLVFGGNLTGWGLLVIVIVLAVYLGLLQLVATWARRVSAAGPSVPSGTA